MKKRFLYIIGLSVLLTQACQEFDTPVPELEDFGIYELIDDPNGTGTIAGDELTTIPTGETVRIQVFTQSDIAILWTGEYSYRPWGEADSILDSHSYEHYGLLGAEGLSTGAIEGDLGWFRDYSWAAGSYTVTVVLTNHGTSGPDWEQRIFDFPITVN